MYIIYSRGFTFLSDGGENLSERGASVGTVVGGERVRKASVAAAAITEIKDLYHPAPRLWLPLIRLVSGSGRGWRRGGW